LKAFAGSAIICSTEVTKRYGFEIYPLKKYLGEKQ